MAREVPKHAGPGLCGRAIAVCEGDDLFPNVWEYPDDHQARQAVLLQADVELDAFGPDMDVFLAFRRALAPDLILLLSYLEHSGDYCG